jgi:hypothetical protein
VNVELVITLAFVGGLAVGYATRSWWSLAITILVPLLVYPGSFVAWLMGSVPYPLLTAGLLTAVIASTGCAAAVFIRRNTAR